MKAMYQNIRGLPTPLAGLALGIASLGWSMENALPLYGYGQSIGAAIALVMILSLLGRFTLHPDTIWQDMKHPVIGSILPTFAMATMVISKAIGNDHASLGAIIWLCAIAVHLVALAGFIYHRSKDFLLNHLVPSWFIPPIGLIVADVTCPNPEYYGIAMVLLVIGMACYAIMLPWVIYRLMFVAEIPDAAKPTIAIMAAPASLSLAGYLTVVETPSPFICAVLLGIALLMTLVVYFAFFKLLRLPFTPGFAAFTFPLVIGATALYKLSDATKIYDVTFAMSEQLRVMAHVELVIATIIVAYVSVCYLRFWLNKRCDATMLAAK